jgi:hypothetical protein
MGYQDKLKRDRIGILFKRAKKNAWDRKEEIKSEEVQKNYKELFLDQDEIENEEEMKKPAGSSSKKGTDYNEMFENRIDADEREFVNYDCMF